MAAFTRLLGRWSLVEENSVNSVLLVTEWQMGLEWEAGIK